MSSIAWRPRAARLHAATSRANRCSMQAPDTPAAAKLLVDCLAEQGCDRVFTVPGESFLQVLDGLSRQAVGKLIAEHQAVAAEARHDVRRPRVRLRGDDQDSGQ